MEWTPPTPATRFLATRTNTMTINPTVPTHESFARMNAALKKFSLFALALTLAFAVRAEIVMTPWIPIFKGVDRAAGTNNADATIANHEVANCVRVDLTDPEVRLLP